MFRFYIQIIAHYAEFDFYEIMKEYQFFPSSSLKQRKLSLKINVGHTVVSFEAGKHINKTVLYRRCLTVSLKLC